MTYHVVSEPSAVREVMRRTGDFAPTNALTSVVPLAPATLRILSKARFALPPVLASATGERHRAVRKVVAGFFTPAKVAAVTPRVRELARHHISATAAALNAAASHPTALNPAALNPAPIDLSLSLARHVPPVIMAELTGQRNPPLDELKTWSRDSLELFWGWPDAERQIELATSAASFYSWLRGEVSASRDKDSLYGELLAAGLSTAEVCSLGYFLVIAGQETTSQLINTALYRGIGLGSAGWQELAGAEGAARHVREVLAAESSVHTWRRSALHATELNGVALPAGAEILLELSGRHAPDAQPTAYSLAFGHGLHRCLGAKLAELETRVVLQETAAALPDLELVGPEPGWLRLLSFQTPKSVMVARSPR